MINVYTDGGARGNPGPAAIGFYITSSRGDKIFSHGEKIGNATNNVAEYKAVIAALEWIVKNKDVLKDTKASFFLDSNLVCSQIRGLFKIKEPRLRELLFMVREKESQLDFEVRYFFVPREKNKEADRIVNMVLDNKPFSP